MTADSGGSIAIKGFNYQKAVIAYIVVTRSLHLDQTPLIFAQMAIYAAVPDVAHRQYFFD